MQRTTSNGFTIVELIIVVVVMGILVGITIVTYNGITVRAATSKRDADETELYNAILAGRAATGKTLPDITGRGWTEQGCSNVAPYGKNTDNKEPKDLPKTSMCWTIYYQSLDLIAAASSINLNSLKAGDAYGNPYIFDENEGEHDDSTRCNKDELYYYIHDGTATRTLWKQVPNSLAGC